MADDRNIDDKILHHILGTFPLFMRKIMHDPKDRPFQSISKTQHKTLMLLYFEGRQHMSGLAEHLNLEKGSFTTVVDDLIRQGLIKKVQDNTDRRRYILEYTSKGETLVKDAINRLKKRLSQRLGILTEEDYAIFLRAVEDLSRITSKL